jgi:hypothetical protein
MPQFTQMYLIIQGDEFKISSTKLKNWVENGQNFYIRGEKLMSYIFLYVFNYDIT